MSAASHDIRIKFRFNLNFTTSTQTLTNAPVIYPTRCKELAEDQSSRSSRLGRLSFCRFRLVSAAGPEPLSEDNFLSQSTVLCPRTVLCGASRGFVFLTRRVCFSHSMFLNAPKCSSRLFPFISFCSFLVKKSFLIFLIIVFQCFCHFVWCRNERFGVCFLV